MKITSNMKNSHNNFLKKYSDKYFYPGFATKTPTTFIKYARYLGDIYAYFMQYDVDNELVMENGENICIPRNSNSQDYTIFEEYLVPSLKDDKQKQIDLFFSGMTALEQGDIPNDISATTLATLAWYFGNRAQRIMKVRHRENTFIAYNYNIKIGDIIHLKCSKDNLEKIDSNSLIYLFGGEPKDLEFLGKYNYISHKIKSKDCELVLIPTEKGNDNNIIDDFIENKKININSEKFPRDFKKRNNSINRAKGICENNICVNKTPFQNDSGDIFLESHHINFLSEGGKDKLDNMIALCPNCHREAHHGKNRKHLKKQFLQIIKEKY